jgi:hypothetical protein
MCYQGILPVFISNFTTIVACLGADIPLCLLRHLDFLTAQFINLSTTSMQKSFTATAMSECAPANREMSSLLQSLIILLKLLLPLMCAPVFPLRMSRDRQIERREGGKEKKNKETFCLRPHAPSF